MSKIYTVRCRSLLNSSFNSDATSIRKKPSGLLLLGIISLGSIFIAAESQASMATLTRKDPTSLLCGIKKEDDPFGEVKKSLKDPTEACKSNLGAKFEETCISIWGHIGHAIEKYEEKKKSKCAEISRAESEVDRCVNSDQSTQKTCLEGASQKLKQAAQHERELAGDLKRAKEEVGKWIDKAEEAKATYAEESNQIKDALQKAEMEEKQLLQTINDPNLDPNVKQGAGMELNQVRLAKTQASGVSGTDLLMGQSGEVVAQNGGVATVREYSAKSGTLIQEQEQAASTGNNFLESASTSIEGHNARASFLEKRASTLMSQAQNLSSVSDKYGQSQPRNGSGSSVLSKTSDTGGGSTATGDAGLSDGDKSSTDGSAASKSPGSSMGGFTPPPPGGGGSSGGVSNPVPPLAGPGTGVTAGSTTRPNTLGGNNSNTDGKANPSTAAGGSTDFAGLPSNAGTEGAFDNSAGSTSYGSSGMGGTMAAAAKSSARGNRGINSSGASVMVGGSLNSRKEEDAKAAANLNGFQPNLDAGGTGILGSEVANAFEELSSEFGLTESGGLTQAEMDAFASLGNAGSDQGSLDGSGASMMPGSETQPLFFRTREAHNRAVKRGNLMTTVKTRL